MNKIYLLIGYQKRVGGVIPSVEAYAAELADKFDCWVVYGENYPKHDAARVRVERVQYIRGDESLSMDLGLSILKFALLSPFRKKLEKGDVVHAHSRGATLAVYLMSFLSPAQFLVTFHGYWAQKWLYRLLRKKRNFHYVCLTNDMARHRDLDPETGECSVISECCDERFSNLAVKRGEFTQDHECKISFVGLGAIADRKRWHHVASAMAQLEAPYREKIRFDLYGWTGRGEEGRQCRETVERIVLENNLSEIFEIHEPIDNVEEVLLNSHWFMFPSSMEPCSVALIEAISSGMPAVVVRDGGSQEIVREGISGVILPPDDIPRLAQAIRDVVDGKVDIGDAKAISESVAHRSASVVADQYKALYLSRLSK